MDFPFRISPEIIEKELMDYLTKMATETKARLTDAEPTLEYIEGIKTQLKEKSSQSASPEAEEVAQALRAWSDRVANSGEHS